MTPRTSINDIDRTISKDGECSFPKCGCDGLCPAGTTWRPTRADITDRLREHEITLMHEAADLIDLLRSQIDKEPEKQRAVLGRVAK